MKKLQFILLLFFSMHLFGQKVEFKGHVVDKNNSNSINKAHVIIEETNIDTFTDANGDFSIYAEIPIGEQIVSFEEANYETQYVIINVVEGKKIEINEIKLDLTKEAKRKRKKKLKELKKRQGKLKKEREDKLAKAKKEKAKKLKKLKKHKKEIKDNVNDDVVITYIPTNTPKPEKVNTLTENQIKYGKILQIEPQKLTNIKLYDFIDNWMGVPYLLGGENRGGIDCSSLSQLLYIKVYNQYIERTAQKQFNSKSREKFSNPDYLKEGDLMFFKSKNENGEYVIGHVGIYLHNGYFVNSTSKRGVNNVKGVQICNINDHYWKKKYVGGARRNKTE